MFSSFQISKSSKIIKDLKLILHKKNKKLDGKEKRPSAVALTAEGRLVAGRFYAYFFAM